MRPITDDMSMRIHKLVQHAHCHGKITHKHMTTVIDIMDEIRKTVEDESIGYDAILYQLMGLPVVNLHQYNKDEDPVYVTIGHHVIASESSEEFNLKPGKSYLVEGVGYDLISVTNELGKCESYSVENFCERDYAKKWILPERGDENAEHPNN